MRYADYCSNHCIFINRVSSCIAVCHCSNVELIHVADRDREGLDAEACVAGGRSDGDVVLVGSLAVDGSIDCNDTRRSIDREPSTSAVIQAIRDGISTVWIGG